MTSCHLKFKYADLVVVEDRSGVEDVKRGRRGFEEMGKVQMGDVCDVLKCCEDGVVAS